MVPESWVAWKSVAEEPILHVQLLSNRLLLLMPHSLQVLDIVRGVKFAEIKEHTAPVVAISSKSTSQGSILYTAAMDNTIRLWDADTLECIKCLKEKKQEITAMVFLPKANVIITGHENSDLKMWSLDSQEAYLRTVTGQPVHENTISALILVNVHGEVEAEEDAAASGFELVVAGSYDRQMSFWRVTLTSDGTAMAKLERAFLAHEDAADEILALGHSPFGSVFSGGNEGIIRQWSIWGGKVSEDFKGHDDAITCFSTDGHFLFSGSADCTVRIWECSHARQMKCVRFHEVAVQAILVVPDTGTVVTCANDGRVVFWDPQIGHGEAKIIRSYEQPEEFRTLHMMSHMLLVGCESGKIVSFPLEHKAAVVLAAATFASADLEGDLVDDACEAEGCELSLRQLRARRSDASSGPWGITGSERCCLCSSGLATWSKDGQCGQCHDEVLKTAAVSEMCQQQHADFQGASACEHECKSKLEMKNAAWLQQW
ncbi:unnamed protein product [Effrenium voratum]|uniref:Uncharacterized protein n=1 Tax=Effrenium voratum TaxID=2562239 RepID=A0AA36MG97_9DINO|nr:unnamed protein product [Effrenium voratum]